MVASLKFGIAVYIERCFELKSASKITFFFMVAFEMFVPHREMQFICNRARNQTLSNFSFSSITAKVKKILDVAQPIPCQLLM